MTEEYNPFDEGDSFERELIPEGPHAVRCARVIEIGKHWSEMYKKEDDKVVVVFAVPAHTIEINGEQKQRLISNPFGINKTKGEKATIRQYTRALCPQGGTGLKDFLNQTAQIWVEHKAREGKSTIDKINSIAPLLPGAFPVPELDIPEVLLLWNDPDPLMWDMVPKFTQDMVKGAVNYPGSYMEEMVNAYESEQSTSHEADVPF